MKSYVGIDVGAGRINAVALVPARAGSSLVVKDRWAARSLDLESVVRFCAGARRIAIDAPGGFSAGAHLNDATVAPKFRSDRCSELPVRGLPPVPWVTPMEGQPLPGWMASGLAVWTALNVAGHSPVETFPAAIFHGLNRRRWPPPKSTPAGRTARAELLSPLVELDDCSSWSHDDLDAAVAAVVAARGHPVAHSCPNPDGSALWVLAG